MAREPLTLGRLVLYGICAVFFGFFLLFNLVWIVATIQAFLGIVGL